MLILRRIALVLGLVALGLGLPPIGHAQMHQGVELVQAELMASQDAIIPGKPLQVGVRLQMADGWHTYWQYAGDAGLPTQIEWTLPDGLAAGEIDWPLPISLLEPGDIQVYAYKGDVVLLTTIQAPESLEPGTTIDLSAAVSWLVCEAICIPGSAKLSLSLPVADTANATHSELFNRFNKLLPSADPPPFETRWEATDAGWTIKISGPPANGTPEFFPLPAENQPVGHPVATREGDAFSIQIDADGALRGVVATGSGNDRMGWMVGSGGSQQNSTPSSGESATAATPAIPNIWLALLYGAIGGLILNLMPCVLPVISLKIFGFMRQAGDDPKKILLHGLVFSAGIFVWFLGLGAIVAILKASGSDVTWAFQFQNAYFNLAIAAIVFVFALNLFGVFEIVLPGGASGGMTGLARKDGVAGSFFQGVFATLLATPCTGPFLGTALGFAFSQPPAVIMAMFASVAAGMSAPYLLLSAKPGWMKYLPKPGTWMERLKQFMGFPLLATLLWLLYIIGKQKGIDGLIQASAFLLCLGLAAWIYGSFCGPMAAGKSRAIALLCTIIAAVGGGWFFIGNGFAGASAPTNQAAATKDGIPWIPFTTATVKELIAAGKPVFIDFTADWCITCKFNLRTAIDRPTVRDLLAEKGIVPVLADWTNANPEITAALAEFGRVGVPFYLLYIPGQPDPVILPELLTENMVLEAFRSVP